MCTASRGRSGLAVRVGRPAAIALLSGALLAGTVAGAGCSLGSDTFRGGSEAGGDPPDTAATGSAGDTVRTEVSPLGENQVGPSLAVSAFPTPDPVGTRAVPGTRSRTVRWTLATTTNGGRRLLLDVPVAGPPCDVVTAVDVVETLTAIRVTVFAGVPGGASCGGPVRAVLGTQRVEALLAEPLGIRPLTVGMA